MKVLLAIATGTILLLAACGGSSQPTGAQTPAGEPEKVQSAGTATDGIVTATLTDSKIVLDHATVPSGKVTFAVKNTGTMVHELVVLKTDIADDKITSDPDEPGKMSEDGSQGESGDLNVGETKTFTLDLTSGHYVLMCNQTGHYVLGMHISFMVQ